VVLLSGEAGIGKSRLTAALLERLAGEPHTRLRYFCSPQHTDSALYPVIGQMERAAGFVHDDTPQAKLDKVDAVLARTSTSIKDAALFAEMPGAPLRALRDAGTTNFYWQYFQTPGMAEVAFERDVEHTVRTLLRERGTPPLHQRHHCLPRHVGRSSRLTNSSLFRLVFARRCGVTPRSCDTVTSTLRCHSSSGK
jgi:hypothetical protein